MTDVSRSTPVTPLSDQEETRFTATMAEMLSGEVAAKGSVRVTAKTDDMRRLFQDVTRRVGLILQRPVISYSNGREMVIALDAEDR
ncbi:hypothetical protein [Rhizohabitans arisaemae]|uniref:hypothetical protein n=1 Tax=Rhizohabitans arisaemae TaxID=2720610 RepID=UPI0024B0D7F6|nr:hypothetical protein [Rhizohabitans arisaemae]